MKLKEHSIMIYHENNCLQIKATKLEIGLGYVVKFT